MDFSRFKSEYPVVLDEQQEAAVQAVDGPALLLAVPGSGKTTTLVTRLGYMLHVRGIAPERILTMTYTVAAERDMRSRYAVIFGDDEAQRLEFRTINGVCSRIIRHYERKLGRSAFDLLEDGARKSAIVAELLRSRSREFVSESAIKAAQTALTYAKNQMLTDKELESVEVEGVDFPPLFRAYCKLLRERRLMDFDDQMVYARRILLQYPDILADFQARYSHFCVDEAQDTSKIQHSVIRLLASHSRNIFMVGDEDQSIYGFRAAYPQALTGFDSVYPDAKVLYMERNYRSGEAIVRMADEFIQKNRSRRPKQMRAARGGGEVREIQVFDRQQQYSLLCSMARGCGRETAVLYRDNDSAIPLIDRLERLGMPYRSRQLDSLFFSNRVVRDISDIIRFAMNPKNGELFLNIYYKLSSGVSKAAALEAADGAEYESATIFERIAAMPGVSGWTKRQCLALRTHLANLLGDSADRAVYRIVHFMGYGSYLEDRGGDLTKAELLEALGAMEPSPARLLERLEELQTIVRRGSGESRCPFILSTIHSSKGLEYDRVVLMDVADGLLPKAVPGAGAPQDELDAYEEERRLFYVGMTRAKNELDVITFKKQDMPSTFSEELFPREKPAEPQGRKLRAAPLAPKPRAIPDTGGYVPGARVRHGSFGEGVILSRSGDIANVAFESGRTVRLSISAALKARKLSLAR